MLSALLLLASTQSLTAPLLPPGSSVTIHQTIESVEQALSKADYAQAKTDAALLPKRTFSIGWDDASIPDNLREQVDEMRDLAIKSWSHIFGLHVSLAKQGDIDIAFVDQCANGSEGIPQASVLTFGAARLLNRSCLSMLTSR
jgi:hypothetical protein